MKNQRTAREGQVWLAGVAERLAVPKKPGNSGGGKGPQLKADATSSDDREIGESLTNPKMSGAVDGITCAFSFMRCV